MPDWYGFRAQGDNWAQSLVTAERWKFNVHRIPFFMDDGTGTANGSNPTPGNEIPDAEIWTRINTILDTIENHGYGEKAIIDHHNYGTVGRTALLGSEICTRKWLALVDHFKNDSRIIGWEIYNEPNPEFLSGTPNYPVYTGRDATYVEALMKTQYELTLNIRGVDSNRPVIWAAYYWIGGDYGTTRYNLLSSPITYTNYTTKISNIVQTSHPYSYGHPTTIAEMDAILAERITGIEYFAQAFPIWIGEIEAHCTADNCTWNPDGTPNGELEKYYVSKILSEAFNNRWGFNIWKYPVMDYYGDPNADECLEASSYATGIVPPYNSTFADLAVNWQAIAGTWSVS